jgi:hypothetical protein
MRNQVLDDKIPANENNNGQRGNMGRRKSFDTTVSGIKDKSPSLKEDIAQAKNPNYSTNSNSKQ